jgi:CRP-like cAMP-binding protein
VRAVLSAETWDSLIARGSPRVFARGEVLVGEGADASHVYVLIDGRVKVTRDEADGTEVLLAIRGAGEIIGEMSVLDEGVASATVTALRPCTTRRLLAPEFMEFVERSGLALPMLRHATARRHESEQVRIELSTLPVERRLVRTLVRLLDAMGVPTDEGVAVDLGVPQEDLARAIGASRSQVAAGLRRLRAEGILSTGWRRVVVRQPDRLRAIDHSAPAGGRIVSFETVRGRRHG